MDIYELTEMLDAEIEKFDKSSQDKQSGPEKTDNLPVTTEQS